MNAPEGAGTPYWIVMQIRAPVVGDPTTISLLLDLDPWGGGIDLLVGGEATPGLRWPDLALQSGRLSWPSPSSAAGRRPGGPPQRGGR